MIVCFVSFLNYNTEKYSVLTKLTRKTIEPRLDSVLLINVRVSIQKYIGANISLVIIL